MTTIMKRKSKHKRHTVGTKGKGAQRVKEFPSFTEPEMLLPCQETTTGHSREKL
jgi:hypothetical protein